MYVAIGSAVCSGAHSSVFSIIVGERLFAARSGGQCLEWGSGVPCDPVVSDYAAHSLSLLFTCPVRRLKRELTWAPCCFLVVLHCGGTFLYSSWQERSDRSCGYFFLHFLSLLLS